MDFSTLIRRIPPVTRNLLGLNILIFVVMSLVPRLDAIFDMRLALHYVESPAFNPVQIVTYMFIHADFSHLFFNMFALWMFGSTIEHAFGSKRFLIYYMCCGVGAAVIQEIVYAIMVSKYQAIVPVDVYHEAITRGCDLIQQGMNFTDPTLGKLNLLVNLPTVGASGAIYGILLAFGMLFPNMPVYIMFIPIPIKAKWMVLGYGVLELTLGVTGAAPGVAHWAHLGGMIFGILLILYWRHRGDINNRYYY